MLSSAQRRQIGERIAALRDELRDSLSGSAAAAETVELDQTRQGRLSRIDALQAQAMAQAAQRRAQQQLTRLAAADQRLSREDFGNCRQCDETIAWPRLLLDPSVQRCIACAEQCEG